MSNPKIWPQNSKTTPVSAKFDQNPAKISQQIGHLLSWTWAVVILTISVRRSRPISLGRSRDWDIVKITTGQIYFMFLKRLSGVNHKLPIAKKRVSFWFKYLVNI